MKCRDFEGLIEEYHDGLLDEELSASVKLHLGGCPDCSEALAAVQTEDRLYRGYREALERELEVTPAMWLRVRACIEPAGPKPQGVRCPSTSQKASKTRLPFWGRVRWLPQLGFAALLVILSIAGTLFVGRYYSRDAGNARLQLTPAPTSTKSGLESASVADHRPVTGDVSGGRSLESAVRAIQRAERDYLEAIQVLTDIVDKRKPTFEAGFVQQLNRNLRAIDESIEATRKAYYAHPSDPYLAQYMLTAYSRKVELLQELAS